MTYVIEIDNGQSFDFKTIDEIKKWMAKNGYETEPNARLYGVDETITDQGSVAIYDLHNKSDQADGRISRA